MTADDGERVAVEHDDNVIRISDISKTYGSNRALDAVGFEIRRGSVHGLLGGNGSGKSTLIKILAGVVAADAGTISLGGRSIGLDAHTPKQADELGFRFVHQQNSTFGDLTVAENLALTRGFETRFASRVDWPAQRRHAQQVLDRLGIPVRPDTPVAALGAAMQMMVAIARALQDNDSHEHGVLVLDEPTASLPRHEVDVLLSAITRLAGAGQTIVLVTHRLPEVMRVCDRATVLRDGVLGAELDRSELTHDRLVAEIMGPRLARLVSAETGATPGAAGAERLLVRTVGGQGLPISVRAGEIVGLAGLLGSGRTSILRRIFGVAARREEVYVDGTPLGAGSPRVAMAAGIALVPEDRPHEALFPDLDISRNLSIADLAVSSSLGRVSARREHGRARRLLSRFAVKAASERLPLTSLSGGNQQKVILARWMQRDPKVLLLDEPTQGVDIGAREELHRQVRAAAESGAAVLVVSSEFEELAALCDRALIVKNGWVFDEVSAEDLNEDTLNDRVYAKEIEL